ncbi:MAG: hypothetical protein C5617_003375 [ANME-2 cluster archaeon]|jgi:predicted RND superfamily exporter protein|nr:MAG: hypothetical protein C5617_003375 [ANME-2 cluster archaeon]
MPLIEDTLRKLAAVQEKYPVLIVLVFTVVMAFGSLRMKLDPSFDGMMPDDLEVIRMQDHLNGIRINRYHARSGGA